MNFFTRSITGIFLIALMSVAYSGARACGFQANQTSGCVGYVLNLQDTTIGAGSTATWDITLPNGNHVITTGNSQSSTVMSVPGIVSVTMTDVVNGVTCTSTVNNIVVNPKPVINGTFSTTVTCVGNCVQWNDASSAGTAAGTNCTINNSSFVIDWGQGAFTGPGQCKMYTQNATYPVSILLTNSCGCTADTTFATAVTVTAPPSAAFTGTPLSSCTSPLVSTMTAPTGVPNSKYFWYVDGTLIQANGFNTFSYAYPSGSHTIKLVTIDTLSGCTDSLTRANYVTAGNQAAACFTASVTGGCAPTSSNFCPCTPNAILYNWTWTGGGPGSLNMTSAQSFTPVCQNLYINNGGTYVACLTVSYTGGCASTTCDTLTYGNRYNVDFAPVGGDSITCTIPECIPVVYTGDPCPACTFTWNPPNNNPNPPNGHTGTCFNASSYGAITPSLTVTDPSGCTSSIVKTNLLNVSHLVASATVGFAHNHGCPLDTAVVTNTSLGGPFSAVIWSFPGGTIVSQSTTQARVIYTTGGCHDFTMIVQTPTGCIDTLRDSICIGFKDSITMSVTPQIICFGLKNQFILNTILPPDTPTVINIWPKGLGGGEFPIQRISFDSSYYIYQDTGRYGFCYQAVDRQCPGDTVCGHRTIDSVRILPPNMIFSKMRVCTNTDSVIVINNSVGADSSFWTFNGIEYWNTNPNKDTFVAVLPQCGRYYPIEITGRSYTDTAQRPLPHFLLDTMVCTYSVSDSVIDPCFGADFTVGATKGCSNYSEPFCLTFPSSTTYRPTTEIWSAQPAPNPPSYIFFPGDTCVPNFQLSVAGVYNICIQLTYSNGCVIPICKDSLVDISNPLAQFTVSSPAGCVPFCVQFTNTSIDQAGQLTHFYWNFGDGSPIDSTTIAPNHCYTTVGQFQAVLTVTDTNGCTSSYTLQLQANIIHANFSVADSITCPANPDPRNPSTYTDQSTGFVAHHQWLLPASLGPVGPAPGDVSSISVQYTNIGCDSVGMVAIDQFYACKDTVWKRICVVNPAADYYLVNPSDTFHSCPPAVVCFRDTSTGGVCSFGWEFGAGGPIDTTRNTCHIYTVPGVYPVTHRAISCHGCVDSSTRYTIIIGGPVVTMTSSARGACPCSRISYYIRSYNADSLSFSVGAGSVTDTNGVPLAYQNIVVPRGTPTNPTLDTLTYIYCGVGDIRPVVTASSNGCQVPYPNLIAPIPLDTPTVDFSNTRRACGVDSVCFTKITTYTAPSAHDSTYLWNFGDGTTSTQANPCHHYATPGNYPVTLSITDNACSSTTYSITKNVHVPAAPHAIYTVDDSFGCSPFVVSFMDSSRVDDSTSYTGYWSFGDATANNPSPANTTHTYNGTATYIATLVIVDGYGCVDSTHHSIQVQGPPTISVGPDQTICLGDTVTITGSGSAPLQWLTDYNISDILSGSPRVWPRTDTTYLLQVGTIPRCEVFDSVHVYVSKFTVVTDTATLICKGNSTAFTALATTTHSTITGSNYSWSYGDAATGSGQNTTHVYSNTGAYTYSLYLTNARGCHDTVTKQLTILDRPHSAFTLSLDSICPNGNILVTNTSTPGTSAALATDTLNGPPGSPFTSLPVNIAYPAAGTYVVSLIETDLNQCADTSRQTVYVIAPPPTYNIDTTICPGDTITLQANGSNTVLWTSNPNNGAIDNTTSVTPRVWPSVNTQYIAQVGALATCYIYDTVNVIISTITINTDTALPACSNQPANFTATATAVNANVSSYDWLFGDNTTATGQNVSHHFSPYNIYHDRLIVTSSRGCKDTAYFTNIIYDIPHAALSLSVDSVCLGGPVTVTNLSTAGASGALTTFVGDFGDGSPQFTVSPTTYTYLTAGSYAIDVIQSDVNGCVDTASLPFVVHALPVASFTADDTSCINVDNQYVSTSTIGDGPIQSYNWTINGTSLGIDSSVIDYTFNNVSNNTICLTVQDNFGCSGNVCKPVVIVANPIVQVMNLDSTICAGFSDTVLVSGNVDRVQWVPSVWVDNPTGTSVVITPRQTIDYQLYVYYKNCVPLIDTVKIWVIDSVPVSASADPENIILGLSSNVTSVVKGTIDSIVWDPDSTLNCHSCKNPVATPHETTTYNATVYYSKNGVTCSNRTSVTITVYQSCDNSRIYVPNTFTPNGDGRNEVFRLRGQGITKVNYFRVYDRWGKLVYEATNADDSDSAAWNGGLHNDTGKPVNSGVFVYAFEIQCITGQTVAGKGNVTLIR